MTASLPRVCASLLCLALASWPLPRAAAQDANGPLGVDIHAFVSPGFIVSTGNNYLAKSKRGSAEFTEIGINFTKQLHEDLRVGVQFFSRDLGPIGNYEVKADWYYVDYRAFDWLGIRAGRVKIPFGLYNEQNDVDAARVPVLLPQSVYPIENRDFLLAQTGGEVYGYLRLGPAGGLDYRAYGGTMFLDVPSSAGRPYDIASLDTPYVVGGRVLWEPLEGLSGGGAIQALRLDSDLLFPATVYGPLVMGGTLPPTFDGKVTVKIPALLWVASLEYELEGLQLAAEYSRWHVKRRSTTPELFPESSGVSERAYGMASYVVMSWLTPGAYFSLLYPDVEHRSGKERSLRDAALTLRFDINPYWLIKLEGHYMMGTAGLSSSLNNSRPSTALERNWSLFLLKTTAYF